MVQKLSCFKIDNNNPLMEFSLLYSSSVISINKIIVDTLLDEKDDEWFYKLYKMNLYLELSGKGRCEQHIDMPVFTFMSVNPVPQKPIFTFNHDFIFPEYNIHNESETDFCKEVKIEVKPVRGQLPDNFSLTFFYDTTPGVAPKDIARVCLNG